MTATNSTVANFFPEHALEPSEKGRNEPLSGFRMPAYPPRGLENVDEVGDAIGDAHKPGTDKNCPLFGDVGGDVANVDLVGDVESKPGEAGRLGKGLPSGESPLLSTIHRSGFHSSQSWPHTFGLRWIAVPLIDMRVRAGMTNV